MRITERYGMVNGAETNLKARWVSQPTRLESSLSLSNQHHRGERILCPTPQNTCGPAGGMRPNPLVKAFTVDLCMMPAYLDGLTFNSPYRGDSAVGAGPARTENRAKRRAK